MKPKMTATNQFALFQTHFKQILNLDHELCRLADTMDWPGLDAHFANCYSEDMGRPGNAIRFNGRIALSQAYLRYGSF